MKQVNQTHRRTIRRQHRLISLFVLIQCWLKGADGLAFTYTDLARILNLRRITHAHIDWLKADLPEFFPYCLDVWSKRPEALTAFFVSHRPIHDIFPKQQNSIPKAIELLDQRGVDIELFSIWKSDQSKDLLKMLETLMPFVGDSRTDDERILSAYLVLLAQGRIAAKRILLMKAGEVKEKSINSTRAA